MIIICLCGTIIMSILVNWLLNLWQSLPIKEEVFGAPLYIIKEFYNA